MDVNCDKSPDGRHEIYLRTGWGGAVTIECVHCHWENGHISDMEDAINAAMRLTAEDAPRLAKELHDIYERLAPEYGYETRKDTKNWDPTSANALLMAGALRKLLASKWRGDA